MKSYVKVYGPPLAKAIRALETSAIESPAIVTHFFSALTANPTSFRERHPVAVKQPTQKLISRTGHTLGDNDFFIQWSRDPTWQELEAFMTKVDNALQPLGCRYTLTTK